MKNSLKQIYRTAIFAGLALAVFGVSGVDAKAQCSACVNAITVPTGNVTFSNVSQDFDADTTPSSGGTGLIAITLSGLTTGESSLKNMTYAAWCGAWSTSPVEDYGQSGFPMYSSYSPALATSGSKPRVTGNTFNMVNYVLNHKQGTVLEVQNALWLIMIGEPVELESRTVSGPARAMADAARNNPDYYPDSGGLMAIFYAVGPKTLAADPVTASNDTQSLFIEVPVPSDGGSTPVPLRLVCPASSATAGSAYSSNLVASGGKSPYTYSFLGALPSGLFLNPLTGVIAGVPGTYGLFNFTAKVTDSANLGAASVATQDCSINISQVNTPLALACPALTAGRQSVPFSSPLLASGGLGIYTFSISGLPAGLTMNASGLVSGTPSVSGTYMYSASVTDPGTATVAQKTCSVTLTGLPTTFCLVTSATQGVPLTSPAFAGTAGSGTGYTFAATGLPAGLLMSSAGVISGTPTVAGTFAYTITITDSTRVSGTMECSLTVAPPVVNLTYVGTGDTATIGFWNNQNGKYILSILDSGFPPQNIGPWLAAQYPGLYSSLGDAACSKVSTLFTQYFSVSGTPKVNAQMLAGAIASYVTNTSASGFAPALVAARTKFGFKSSPGGTAPKLYNVGTSGAAIGVPNNSVWTVGELLAKAGAFKAKNTFTATVSNAFNVVFSGINQKGDIK